jgi:hypothetical protein
MNSSSKKDSYKRLGELLLSDFDIRQRRSQAPLKYNLDEACSAVLSLGRDRPIVYTAFDGDHFQLCGHMRSYVLQRGCVPANPESILGYKDTVTARLTKPGVLRDDLSVLRSCQQLWVFTDEPATPDSLQDLAEGVVVEILYFLKRQERPEIYFISPLGILGGEDSPLVKYQFSYEDSKFALHPEQCDGILELANSGTKVDKELPPIAYHITDPLDFKYAHWLRPRAYDLGYAPLVPGLAVHLRDLGGHPETLTDILISWARLCSIATVAWQLPSMESGRSPSAVTGVLERVWLRMHGASTMHRRSWTEYPIPKARVGPRWPLTRKEGGMK